MPISSIERERREYYRLQFPQTKRPQLLINENSHAVVDCSAHGVRYVTTKETSLAPGERVKGLLQFQHGKQTPVRGVVMRVEADEIILHIPDQEIPSKLLRSEERHLLKASTEVVTAADQPPTLPTPKPPSATPAAEGDERREFHRIRYPNSGCPSLYFGQKEIFSVVDISARGLRYATPQAPMPELYQQVRGTLRLRRNVQITIEGTVIRAQNDEASLYLHQEIPLKILLAEQRHLQKSYPMWSSSSARMANQ